MNNDIIDKFLNFLKKEVSPPIKKDLKWLSKTITKDLEKLTTEKKSKKKIIKKIKILFASHIHHTSYSKKIF